MGVDPLNTRSCYTIELLKIRNTFTIEQKSLILDSSFESETVSFSALAKINRST